MPIQSDNNPPDDVRRGDETDDDERSIGYVANPVEEVRQRELKAAEDVKKGGTRPADKITQKARDDAKAQKDAEYKHRQYERDARALRMKEAEKLEIGPTHPLHPRQATNPSNPTSPVTHDPSILPAIDTYGLGEP